MKEQPSTDSDAQAPGLVERVEQLEAFKLAAIAGAEKMGAALSEAISHEEKLERDNKELVEALRKVRALTSHNCPLDGPCWPDCRACLLDATLARAEARKEGE